MATVHDARRFALTLPETDEHPSYGGAPSWRVRGKAFVWERPLRAQDLAEVGEQGEVLRAFVADEGVKAALLADEPDIYSCEISGNSGHSSRLCLGVRDAKLRSNAPSRLEWMWRYMSPGWSPLTAGAEPASL